MQGQWTCHKESDAKNIDGIFAVASIRSVQCKLFDSIVGIFVWDQLVRIQGSLLMVLWDWQNIFDDSKTVYQLLFELHMTPKHQDITHSYKALLWIIILKIRRVKCIRIEILKILCHFDTKLKFSVLFLMTLLYQIFKKYMLWQLWCEKDRSLCLHKKQDAKLPLSPSLLNTMVTNPNSSPWTTSLKWSFKMFDNWVNTRSV